MKKPKISVIVPCYNVAPFLERCLDSLLEQTLRDIEIICIDDKSTDNTLRILTEYSKKDKRVILISHSENLGAATARNDGMGAATGEYIGFVDPDDYIDLDFYEKLYKAATSAQSDVAKACLLHAGAKTKDCVLNNRIRQHVANFYGEFTTAIYKRTFLSKHKISFPSDVITGQDSVFLTHVAISKPSISIIDDVVYWYSRRNGSLDSPLLTHAKVLSRYKMIMHKIKLIESAGLMDAEYHLFMKMQVLLHIYSVIHYKYEIDDDRNMFWDYLHALYQQSVLLPELQDVFGKKILSCMKSKNCYKACDFHLCGKKKRLYLFFVIPILCFCTGRFMSLVKLFDFLPVLRIENYKSNNKKYYLFGFIPLLKSRG